jgi:hypothetical protein
VHRLGKRESRLATPYAKLAGVLRGTGVIRGTGIIRGAGEIRGTALSPQGQQVIVASLGGLPTV